MDFLKLTVEKLDPTEISELVADDGCGAIALFAGTTRDNFEGKQVEYVVINENNLCLIFFITFKVISLQYEAYDEMAKKEMANICYEIRQRWPNIKHIAMHHRLGFVPVKEASVVIAISSPHRQSSLEALPFALDELKKTVPVWKKEFYKADVGEASSQWKENPECTWSKKHQTDQNIL